MSAVCEPPPPLVLVLLEVDIGAEEAKEVMLDAYDVGLGTGVAVRVTDGAFAVTFAAMPDDKIQLES
jgi:hypothetical protein